MIQFKETKKLYQGKYQHRIVLVCSGVHVFRGGDLDNAFKRLSTIGLPEQEVNYFSRHVVVRSQQEIDFLFEVYQCLSTLTDYAVRVENPWLSIYTNKEDDIEKLREIDKKRVKAIYRPLTNLLVGEIVSTLPFDYRVTVRSSKIDLTPFCEWAETNEKIRLTGSLKSLIARPYPNRTAYFYVKGDYTLTMSKLHLGGFITKIDRIVNPT